MENSSRPGTPATPSPDLEQRLEAWDRTREARARRAEEAERAAAPHRVPDFDHAAIYVRYSAANAASAAGRVIENATFYYNQLDIINLIIIKLQFFVDLWATP